MLDLGGVHLILGMEWLEVAGKTTLDWWKKIASFEMDGLVIMLLGYDIQDNQHTTPDGETVLQGVERQEDLPLGGRELEDHTDEE